jgi:hypothetical protein
MHAVGDEADLLALLHQPAARNSAEWPASESTTKLEVEIGDKTRAQRGAYPASLHTAILGAAATAKCFRYLFLEIRVVMAVVGL